MKKFYKKYGWIINLFINLLFLALLFAAIYKQIFLRENRADIWGQYVRTLEEKHYFLPLIILLLVPLNWGLEAIKWQLVIRRAERVSFWMAGKAVLGGLALGVFTPNRVGEYAGRVLFLEKANKVKALLVTLVGSVSQMLVTVTMGLAGLLYYLYAVWQVPLYALPALGFISLLLASVLLLLYFNVPAVHVMAGRIPYLRKMARYTDVLTYFNFRALLLYFALSYLRYFVFSAQYLIMLEWLGIHLPPGQGMMILSLIFLVQMAVPSIVLLEAGVRGSIAVILMGEVIHPLNPLYVVSATLGIWMVNLIFPALVGACFVAQLKWIKE